jgi:hypothetical protein
MRQSRSRRDPANGSLAWVINKYEADSKEWKKAKGSTKEVYQRRFDWLTERYGTAEFASFTESGVRKIRNKLRDRPSVANATVDMIGRLTAASAISPAWFISV